MARALVVSLACGLLVASYAASTAAPRVRSVSATGDCTGARRAVQTLTDKAATSVNLKPRVTTAAKLRRVVVPTRLGKRIKGIETTTYRMDVRLVQMRLEPNGDILVLVLDPQTHGKMFVAFPPAACIRAAGPAVRKAMTSARAALVAACGKPDPGSITRIGGRATITGVGYVQPGERTADAAPNGFELKPVLAFRSAQCLLGG